MSELDDRIRAEQQRLNLEALDRLRRADDLNSMPIYPLLLAKKKPAFWPTMVDAAFLLFAAAVIFAVVWGILAL